MEENIKNVFDAGEGAGQSGSFFFFSKDKKFLRVCNFMNDKLQGMQHKGDDISGKGDGDDERMRIDFDKVPQDT